MDSNASRKEKIEAAIQWICEETAGYPGWEMYKKWKKDMNLILCTFKRKWKASSRNKTTYLRNHASFHEGYNYFKRLGPSRIEEPPPADAPNGHHRLNFDHN